MLSKLNLSRTEAGEGTVILSWCPLLWSGFSLWLWPKPKLQKSSAECFMHADDSILPLLEVFIEMFFFVIDFISFPPGSLCNYSLKVQK